MRAHSTRNCNHILHGDQLDVKKIFTGSTTFPALAKMFGDTNADVRSVYGTVAKLFVFIYKYARTDRRAPFRGGGARRS